MQKLKPRDKLKIIRDGIEYEFEVAEEGGYLFRYPNSRDAFLRATLSNTRWR